MIIETVKADPKLVNTVNKHKIRGKPKMQIGDYCWKGFHLLSEDSFYIRPNGRRQCKECRREWNHTWNQINKDKNRTLKLRRKFGLSSSEYDILYNKQNGMCPICKKDLLQFVGKLAVKVSYPCIDHCHKTGTVRGLLCNNCNAGIGYLKDNVHYLRAAIEYLTSGDDNGN